MCICLHHTAHEIGFAYPRDLAVPSTFDCTHRSDDTHLNQEKSFFLVEDWPADCCMFFCQV